MKLTKFSIRVGIVKRVVYSPWRKLPGVRNGRWNLRCVDVCWSSVLKNAGVSFLGCFRDRSRSGAESRRRWRRPRRAATICTRSDRCLGTWMPGGAAALPPPGAAFGGQWRRLRKSSLFCNHSGPNESTWLESERFRVFYYFQDSLIIDKKARWFLWNDRKKAL